MTDARKAYLIGFHLGRIGSFYSTAADRLNLRDSDTLTSYLAGRRAGVLFALNASAA